MGVERAPVVLRLGEPPGSTLAPPTFCSKKGMREGGSVLRAGIKAEATIISKMERLLLGLL